MSEPDDLDALVIELNAGAPKARSTDEQTVRLRSWLEQAVQQAASDLLLVPGAPPSLRIDGQVVALLEGPLGGEEIEDAVTPALAPHARRIYRETGIADGSFRTPISAASGSTCTTSAAAPLPRSAACRPRSRASRRSTCRRRSKRSPVCRAAWSWSAVRPAPARRRPWRR
jgi:hypothetical protein